MRYLYPAVVTENELGGYSVDFPDFACCVTDGDDMRDAMFMAAEALELAIESEIEQGHDLPEASYALGESRGGTVVYVSADVDTDGMMVTSSDAADMLGVSSARVRQMILSGQLASEKRGRDNFVYVWSIRKRLGSPVRSGRPRKQATA